MAGAQVKLVSLTKRFTEVAVDGIDLEIQRGAAPAPKTAQKPALGRKNQPPSGTRSRPAPRQRRPVMEATVSLIPVTEHDFDILYRLTSDPACTGPHEWYGWQDPGAYRRRWAEDGLLSEDGGILMVVEGVIRLGFVAWRKHQTARTSYCWTIGIALEPSARGLGHGTEAQRQLVRYLFAHTQVNRIEASTEVTNIPEQHALEKVGFTPEGVLRGIAFQNGRWHDGVLYSILRAEADPENP